MKATEDKLANALGIESPPPSTEIVVTDEMVEDTLPTTQMVPAQEEEQVDPEVDEDYNFARRNVYNLIEKGNQAVNGILNVAHEGQSPRAYEVAANLIKTLGDMSDKLLTIQKTKRELKPQSSNPTNTTNNVRVEKAVFVGSSTDLLKMVREEQKTLGKIVDEE